MLVLSSPPSLKTRNFKVGVELDMTFIHLGVHSEFSIIDSIARVDELVQQAATCNMPALALTDLSNLHAAVKFYTGCRSKGIKPILGSEVRLEDTLGRVTLLAMNQIGWRHLTEVVSQGYIEGLTLGTPLIKTQWVFNKNNGLIALLGQNSDVGQALRSATPERADTLLEAWRSHFGDRVYIMISRTGRMGESAYVDAALALAERLQVPVVAHNDVRFLVSDDFDAHEARVCIASSCVLADERRPREYTSEQYFKNTEEMVELFSDVPEAIQNTIEIAKRCTVTIELGKNYLPDFPVPEGYDIARFFAEVSEQGLNERLEYLYPVKPDDWETHRKIYDDRLAFEIKTINDMGFPGYFLIVMDFIRWSKNNGVPVGPGRGSGAGSLVAYSLGITDLDPLKYDLLFERFLNPERVSMPDFDIDFCIAGRDRVIEYVANTYGREAVSQIITFGTMAAKGAVRDVTRVLGKAYGLGNRISSLIPSKPPGITLAEALEVEPQLKDLVMNQTGSDYDDVNEIWEMATKLEGITRNVGKHAGGVLIAPSKISDFSAVYCDDEGSRVSQFDKDDVEKVGLVKFDFLGLRNLTVIDQAVNAINARNAETNKPLLDLNHIALDDKLAFKTLQDAKTTAVFQLESSGMKRMLKEAKPSKFEEIIAFVALYRPGPMDLIPDFIYRMHGGDFEYLHPLLIDVLKPTYGVMVYQEQVMQAAQVCAGYSLGGADLLRRAMGKKKPEEMVIQRVTFVEGAATKGIDERKANEIFDYIEKFAGYGFNKSHAAAYALVSYHTAWLKAHYPSEFMAAVLTSEMQNTDNIVFLISDCRELGLNILPPSVNWSDYRFRASDSGTIIYGLGAIKGVGEAAMESVMNARKQGGEFKDIFGFCQRIDLKKANKRTLEALIRSGALDCLTEETVGSSRGEFRSVLASQLEEAVQAAEQTRQNLDSGIFDLFGEIEVPARQAPPKVPAWADEIRLKGEKDTLGLFLTGHPIDVYAPELKNFIRCKLADIEATRRGVTTVFAGLVLDVANFPNRVVITLDDGTARLEVNCQHENFARYKDILKPDAIIIIEGEISEREGYDHPIGRLRKAFTMNDIRSRRTEAISLTLNNDTFTPDIAKRLQAILPAYIDHTSAEQRRVPLQFQVDHTYSKATISVGERWYVRPEDELLKQLREHFGKTAVSVLYQRKTQASEVRTG
jgi:DNA polymerase-3 subunit alpha